MHKRKKPPNTQGNCKRNFENHDLYFFRIWNKEELWSLMTYMEENYAKYFSISESIQKSVSIINLSPELLEVLGKDSIIKYYELEEFWHHKKSDKFIEFESYDGLTKEEITSFISIKEFCLTFTNFIGA